MCSKNSQEWKKNEQENEWMLVCNQDKSDHREANTFSFTTWLHLRSSSVLLESWFSHSKPERNTERKLTLERNLYKEYREIMYLNWGNQWIDTGHRIWYPHHSWSLITEKACAKNAELIPYLWSPTWHQHRIWIVIITSKGLISPQRHFDAKLSFPTTTRNFNTSHDKLHIQLKHRNKTGKDDNNWGFEVLVKEVS